MTSLSSTSILSLQESLNKFDSVARLSPSSTQDASEGGTRASESPRRATRSLLGSVKGRIATETSNLEPNSNLLIKSFLVSPSSTASYSSEEILIGVEPKFQETPPSVKSQVTEESWDEISTASLIVLDQEEIGKEEGIVGAAMMSVTSLTNSQEEEGLIKEVTRSQSDFSRWLEETMKLAKGDGTSVVDSEEAFFAMNDAAREARSGIRSSYSGSEFGERQFELGSPFQFQPPGQGVRSPLSLRSDAVNSSEDEEVLLNIIQRQVAVAENELLETPGRKEMLDETINDDNQMPVVIAAKYTEVKSKEQQALQRYQITSVVLFFALSTSLLRANLPEITSYIYNMYEVFENAPIAILEEEIFLTNYTDTFITHSPVPIGTPLSYPLVIISSLVLLVLTSIPLTMAVLKTSDSSSLKRSRSTSPPPTSVASLPPPPLLLNPTIVLSTRIILPRAIDLYQSHHYSSAIKLFEEVLTNSMMQDVAREKSIIMEWIGRCWYRIARGNRNVGVDEDDDEVKAMREAIKAFERSIRLNGGRSSNRISLGRCWFRISELDKAKNTLELGVKKENGEESNQLRGMAREFLGKTLVRLGQLKEGEVILRSGQLLNPHSYTLVAFLGELLAEIGINTVEAKKFLNLAIALRNDYPVVHARLASIATSELNHSISINHLQQVISTRETGYHDDTFPPSTNSSILGSSPYLRLYFSYPPTPTTSSRNERITSLKSAHTLYPHENLISILLWINLRRSLLRTEREHGLKYLRLKEVELENRVKRYGERDLEAKGLWAMVLLGLGRQKKAEGIYEEFWRGVGGKGRRIGEVNGGLAFLVLGFYELRKMR